MRTTYGRLALFGAISPVGAKWGEQWLPPVRMSNLPPFRLWRYMCTGCLEILESLFNPVYNFLRCTMHNALVFKYK